jgi:hypothetical protein
MGLSAEAFELLPGELLIDLVAILDRKHKNDDYIILNRADRPPIANTILPKLSQLRTYECGANASRVFPALYSLVKEPQYPCGYLAIELFKIFPCTIAQPNLPGHILS